MSWADGVVAIRDVGPFLIAAASLWISIVAYRRARAADRRTEESRGRAEREDFSTELVRYFSAKFDALKRTPLSVPLKAYDLRRQAMKMPGDEAEAVLDWVLNAMGAVRQLVPPGTRSDRQAMRSRHVHLVNLRETMEARLRVWVRDPHGFELDAFTTDAPLGATKGSD